MNFMLLSIKFIIIIIIIITEHGFSMLGFSPMEFFWPVQKKLVISYCMDLELGD